MFDASIGKGSVEQGIHLQAELTQKEQSLKLASG